MNAIKQIAYAKRITMSETKNNVVKKSTKKTASADKAETGHNEKLLEGAKLEAKDQKSVSDSKAEKKKGTKSSTTKKSTEKKSVSQTKAAESIVKENLGSQEETEMLKKEAQAGKEIQEKMAVAADEPKKAMKKTATKKTETSKVVQSKTTQEQEAENKKAAQALHSNPEVKEVVSMLQEEAKAGTTVQKEVAVSKKSTSKKAQSKKETKAQKSTVKKSSTAQKKEVIQDKEKEAGLEKETPKKTQAKTSKAQTTKTEKGATKKTTRKKSVAEKKVTATDTTGKPLVDLSNEKLEFYMSLSDALLEDMAKALVNMDWETLKVGLQGQESPEEYLTQILWENKEQAQKFTFEKDGFDSSALVVLLDRIERTLPFRVEDQAPLKDRIEDALKFVMSQDALADAEGYHRIFDLQKELLMIAQQENIHDLHGMNDRIQMDTYPLLIKFMDTAYEILPTWKYDDVKFYEGFLYGVLSQFNDLEHLHTKAMMDVADLYILHGDYGKGDAEYNYIIRENDIKDQIYYRFARVYQNIDLNKAKAIAGSALQYVDGRFDYYPAIIQILESE